jgi:hypothetical protein
MSDAFARCYLLVFGQLAVGGFMALSAPPFHEIDRGFFKSTAAVYLGAGLAAFLGLLSLALDAADAGWQRWLEVGAWALFCACASAYVATLWGEAAALRARLFTLTLFTGVLAATASAEAYRLAGPFSLEAVLYPLNLLLAALSLGAVATGMILGHWYLIETGLSIEPLVRIFRLFVWSMALQAGVGALSLGLLWLAGSEATLRQVHLLFADHWMLLAVRVAVAPVAAAGLAWMIWRTLLVPQTMAATGLFYIATLSVIVGELLGRFILFRTSLPL